MSHSHDIYIYIHTLGGGGSPGGKGWGEVGCNNVHVTCVDVDATVMLCYVVGWGGVQQRSCNLCGRGCNVLAVHYLNKKPGLEGVVKALGRFRQLAMKSCRQPTLVFKEAPWDGWNRKNSCLTALGNFDDMQKHWEFPMKNSITSKYLWKHNTLYPFPMIFDISLNVHLVIPTGKKNTQKKCCHGPSTTSTSADEKFWSVIERHQTWNELHQKSPFYQQ